MMKILSVKDRFSLKYSEGEETIEIIVRPLTVAQKLEIASKVKIVKGEEIADFSSQAYLCVKYSIVDIKGLSNEDGSEYVISKDGESLDDATTDDLVEFMSTKNLLANTYYAANKMLDKIEGVEVKVVPKK